MARIRSIHPGLASDEAYMSMSMAAKAAWPILWTECDDHGIFEWKPIVLKARIFPADNVDFAAILTEYETLGRVQCREEGGRKYGYIHNFCKFQRPKHPSYRYELPEDMAVFVGLSGSPPPALPEPSPPTTEITPQMKEEVGVVGGEKKEEKKKTVFRAVAKATRTEHSEFKNFWEAYPRRKGANPRWPASLKFSGLVAAGADPTAIIAAAGRYATEQRNAGKENTEFVAQAQVWLNQRRHEDYTADESKIECTKSSFLVVFGSPEWEAWLVHTRQNGPKFVFSQMEQIENIGTGAWTFQTKWPPGFAPPDPPDNSTEARH